MRHVNWPTRKEAIMATILVIVISVVVAYMLGAFDYIFSIGLKALLQF
jgi:preprotein translocase SecE subunit